MVTTLLGRSRALLAARRGWFGPGFVSQALTQTLFFDPEVALPDSPSLGEAVLRMHRVLTDLKNTTSHPDLLVAIIPPRCSFDTSACRENGAAIVKSCRELGVRYVDLQEAFDREANGAGAFTLFESKSGHLSELGNTLVADQLARELGLGGDSHR
jgi:hypothetical protein